jgi:hypothetical protein
MIMYPFLLSLFLSSNPSQAGTAVVPHLHGQGLDQNLLMNISRLLADEVQFHDKYSDVHFLSLEESKITPDCLRSTRCVYKHAKLKGSRTAIAGKVFVTGDKLEFYLVLCERGYFKRNIRFQLDNDVLAIAAGITPYVEELVMGKPKKSARVEQPEEVSTPSAPIILNEDEQVDINIDDSETEDLMGGSDLGWGAEDVPVKPVSKEDQKEEERRKLQSAQNREKEGAKLERERLEKERLERDQREQKERERLEKERREREKRERLEKERREREERERLERERREQKERERLERERLEKERRNKKRQSEQSGLGEEEKAAALLAAMRREKEESQERFELEPVTGPPEPIMSDFDLDTPTKPKKKKKKKKKKSPRSSEETKVRITARVGVSKFQTLPTFITYGGEISYFLVPNFDIVIGAEAFATKRLISSDLLEQGESPVQWNTIIPINIGGLYHIDMEAIIPYVGADIVMLPGYVREANSAAMGMRLRTGIDFPVADKLHFNVNISAGFWSGEDFKVVQADLESFGAIPQFSGGVSFLF